MGTSGYTKKSVDVGDRKFDIHIISFDNGNFVSVSEDVNKIGSMVVSIGSGPAPTTVTVIPAKTDSLFLKLIAERLSTTVKGISIVCLYAHRELGNDAAKILMAKIMEMIRQ